MDIFNLDSMAAAARVNILIASVALLTLAYATLDTPLGSRYRKPTEWQGLRSVIIAIR